MIIFYKLAYDADVGSREVLIVLLKAGWQVVGTFVEDGYRWISLSLGE